jgi:hypothetical protein
MFDNARDGTMWIPTKIYEALPAIYFAVGASLIGGALYLGVSHGPGIGYLILGSLCIGAGVVVSSFRHSARNGRHRSRS